MTTLREMNEAATIEALTAVKALIDPLLVEVQSRTTGMTDLNRTPSDTILAAMLGQITMMKQSVDTALGSDPGAVASLSVAPGMPPPSMPA